MKIETETLDDHQVRLTVTLEEDQLDSAKKQAARRISRNTKIPGFRPGKAPYPVVARTVGDATVVEEALEILVDTVYPEVLEESGIEPYGPGTLENVESMEPPVFDFVVPLAPTVELGDYKEIRIDYNAPEPSDSEVIKVIDDLRERQAVIEHVDRPAEAGDIVYITLTGDDQAADADTEAGPIIPERKMNILIDTEEEGPPDEWPFSGFNQDLIMTEAGDVREIEYEYPDEDEAGSFRGKTVGFEARIDEVVSRELPELNDEFAQTVGEFETAEELREYVSTSFQENAVREYDESYNQKILDQLVEISVIDYPPQMTEHELEHMVENFQQQIAGMGMDLTVYLKTRDMTKEDLEEEMKPDAETRIQRSLVLLEFISQADLKVDPAEVHEELEQTLAMLAQSNAGQPAGSRLSYSRDQLQTQLLNRHVEQEAFAMLKGIASGEEEQTEESDDPQPEDPKEDEEAAEVDSELQEELEASPEDEVEETPDVEPEPKEEKPQKAKKKSKAKKSTKQEEPSEKSQPEKAEDPEPVEAEE